MTPSECMRVLELPASATLDEVKVAYRRLAQELHPDKHPGSRNARERFIRVSQAYRSLTRAARVVRSGRAVGCCSTCHAFGEVVRNQEGLMVCPRCALGHRQRYLPLPVLIVVRCTVPLVLLLLASYLLWRSINQFSFFTAIAALVLALGSLVSLAAICLRVLHCLPPAHLQRSRRRSYSVRKVDAHQP